MNNSITLTILAKNLASQVLNTISQDVNKLQNTAKSIASNGFRIMGDAFNSSASVISTGGGVIAGALGLIGKAGLDSSAKMEKMRIALETAMGGNIQATEDAQKTIIDFAKKTPYQLDEVMRAFVKLKNMGLDPSTKALTSYGDTASAMGKSLNDMIEAVADAATGEFERLKEFGIKASSQGDRVKFTFKGVTTEVGKNAEEIEKYLINLGQTNFAGGMEKQSKSLLGIMSTLTDNISLKLGELTNKIGLSDFFKQAASNLSSFIENIDVNSLIDKITNLKKELDPLISFIANFIKQSGLLQAVLAGLAGTLSVLAIGGFGVLAINILAATWPLILLTGLFAGLYLAFQNQNSILAIVIDLFGNLSNLFQTYLKPELETLMVVWEMFIYNINTLWAYLQPLIAILYILATQALSSVFYAFDQLRKPVNDFIQAVFELTKPILDILAPAFVFLVGIITTLVIPTFQLLWAFVVQAFKGILEIITGVIKIITGILNIFVGTIKGLFTGDFSQAIDGFKQLWGGLVKFFWGIIDLLLSPIRGFIDGIRNIFKGFDIAQLGINMMQNLANSLWSMKDKIMAPVWNTVNSIQNAFSSIRMPNISMPKFATGGVVPKFATGGVIPGNLNTGDRILAAVNSGEMVLNKSQQATLFDIANGKTQATNNNNKVEINVNFNGTFLGSEKDKFDFLTFIENQLARKVKQIIQTV
jgi:phage-related protein